ncbi:hypothetical protein ACWEOO_00235 [Kribbella sp. NPDC004138]
MIRLERPAVPEVLRSTVAMSYTWENLLPARADRIRAKGNRFPIERPDRASQRRSPTTTSTSR